MGEKQNQPFQLSFNASLKIDFQGSRVTSDGGLILVRELDEHLGFGELIARHLTDSRKGKNTQLPLADLLRQSVYSRIAGYEDVNDDARVSQDPTFRLIGSEKIWDRGAALTSRLPTFETEMLSGLVPVVEGSGWAEIQRNRATQGAKAEGVFAEGSEKTGVRDFGFCEQLGSPVLRGRKRLPEEECGSQERRMAVWLILNESWKSKMEIPVKCIAPFR
jgi:hypothetical protein